MEGYVYKVNYINYSNQTIEKEYLDIDEIKTDFNITRDQIINFYMCVSAVKHDSIVKIERKPIPLKKPCNIIIDFN